MLTPFQSAGMEMSHISHLRSDQLVQVFSFLPFIQWGELATVSKQWYLLHSHECLWNPVLKELKSLTSRCEQLDDKILSRCKVLFLNLLKRHETMADTIMKLISDEEKLSFILNAPSFSIEEFKEMRRYSRSFHIWRQLSINSTGLLKSLIDQVQVCALNVICSRDKLSMDLEDQYLNVRDNPHALLLFSLIQVPISPFNGAKMIDYLQPVALSQIPVLSNVNYLAYQKIIDAHHKFPELLADQL